MKKVVEHINALLGQNSASLYILVDSLGHVAVSEWLVN